jgi:hypothetical protein
LIYRVIVLAYNNPKPVKIGNSVTSVQNPTKRRRGSQNK